MCATWRRSPLTTIALRPRPSDIAYDEIHDKRPVIESDACREDHDAVMTAHREQIRDRIPVWKQRDVCRVTAMSSVVDGVELARVPADSRGAV
jgi:hypothetical protein